jgi:hypothetical protein
MASRYSSQGKGSGNGNGDDTDRSLNRRMKKLGKSSKPAFDTETESDESSSSDDGRGERRKYKKANNSRYRSRSTRRARSEAGQGAEPRFSGKFDGNGVLIEASAEREAANMRARIDKEKRYIAEARPHKARRGVAEAVTSKAMTGKSNEDAPMAVVMLVIDVRTSQPVKNLLLKLLKLTLGLLTRGLRHVGLIPTAILTHPLLMLHVVRTLTGLWPRKN